MNVFGHFYFKILADGILSGEYANKPRPILEPETATPKPNEPNLPLGEYYTIWEEQGVEHEADLSITVGQSEGHYVLIWKQNDNPIYEGNGFIMNDLLIGHYWKL